MNKEDTNYMNVTEVAEFMGVSKTAVYNWKKNGLKGIEQKVIGLKKRVVFTVEDLERYFKVDDIETLRRKQGGLHG